MQKMRGGFENLIGESNVKGNIRVHPMARLEIIDHTIELPGILVEKLSKNLK